MGVISFKRTVCILVVVTTAIMAGCGGGDDDGACLRGSGITQSCGDDFTSGQCDIVNGRFSEGNSCADLGFSST
jgi:hypothetical protein